MVCPEEWWPYVRESMLKTLTVTNTGMAVAIDVGSTNTIHPTNKRDVGQRLSLNLYNGAGLPASPFRTDNW